MYLLYLDDSGSVGNRNEDYLVLGGVAVFERQVYFLNEQIEHLAGAVYPQNPALVEFHASDIFSGRQPPWNGLHKVERRRYIEELLSILANSHHSVRAFACAIHKPSYLGSDPIELAFEDLCKRFDLLLARIYRTEKDPQRGLIILDKSSHETSLQKAALDFKSLGTRWGVIRNIVDVPFFVNSKSSRLIQLADHIAYAVFRRYQAKDTSYFDIIVNKFDAEDSKLHGLVHKQTYDPDCKCPACMSRDLA
jgi:hypothetical protein